MNNDDQPLLTLTASAAGNAPAIGAPGRCAQSYAALNELQLSVRDDLAHCGVGANDRVAMVLPNGPAMATGFLCIASSATAAPLNPAYRESEFEFYLSDLAPKAIVVDQTLETPARDVAVRLGIPIVDLVEDVDHEAGRFTLDYVARGRATHRPAVAADQALVLHTSGTTSRPKMVPLTQANLCASAGHIGATLSLTSADLCLNVMPLFHIHGLVAAVLASLASGGQVACTPGFNAINFFGWLDRVSPTWYTAVPTMHQLILERAEHNREIIAAARLRFIRSSSSSLPPQIMQRLEADFGCPVIESYGMTEAAHQMTSNPLPPAPRKLGAVGLPAGPEVRIATPVGDFLDAGNEGEIVIRGAGVTAGYENNPSANETAYMADPDGGGAWFRTGDLGVVDDDGYVTISGRIKEIINRGGEKIAPREVDEVLMDHEAVKQAVTFAMSHPKLGEDVAAAVVLHDLAEVSKRDLRDFAAARLARFKVPRTIHFVTEIPKGSTGKVQRIGLAKKLGLE